MKKFYMIAMTLMIIFPMTSLSQESLKTIKLYKTWITTMTVEKIDTLYPDIVPKYHEIKHIYTYNVNKEDITVVSKKYYEQGNVINEANLQHIAVSNIKVISFARTGNWWRGALIGSSVIFVAGFVTGCILYDPDVTWAVPRGVIGLAVGAGSIPLGFAIGSGIGSKRNRYDIGGNQESFDKVRPELEKCSIKYYY